MVAPINFNDPVFGGRVLGSLEDDEVGTLRGILGGLTPDQQGLFQGGRVNLPDLRRLLPTLQGDPFDFLQGLLGDLTSDGRTSPFPFPLPGEDFRFGQNLRGLDPGLLSSLSDLLLRNEEAVAPFLRGLGVQRPELQRIFNRAGLSAEDNEVIRQVLIALNALGPSPGPGGQGPGPAGGAPDVPGPGGFPGGGPGDTGFDIPGTDTPGGFGGFGGSGFQALPPELRDRLVEFIFGRLDAPGLDPEFRGQLETGARTRRRQDILEGTRATEEAAARRGTLRSGMTQRDVERLETLAGSQFQQAMTSINALDQEQMNAAINQALQTSQLLGSMSLQEQELALRQQLGLLGIDLDRARLELAETLGLENIRLEELNLAMQRAINEFLMNQQIGIGGLFGSPDGGFDLEDLLNLIGAGPGGGPFGPGAEPPAF